MNATQPIALTQHRARLDGDGAPAAVRCGRTVITRPHLLDGELTQLRVDGYAAAEIAVETLHCILGGRLNERHVADVAETCARHAGTLAYSVHSPAVLNLRDQRYPEVQREILLCSVRFAAAIGARVLVVHYEARSEDPAIEAQYRAAIAEAAELAGQHALILGIENIEVERSERVLEFLEGLRHPWVRMTYDFGHDYLAGDLFGYDHLESARACAPYAAHLHLTDNFGHFNQARLGDFNLYRAIPLSHVAVMGLGDVHMPLGWGTLPAEQVYGHFASHGYAGLLISEHDPFAYPGNDEAVCAALQALTATAGRA
ncbi:MAG: xylose isomerase [Chloroflexi bacterium]|nr:xylose isomerase [Chloroflexota bacterium]